MQYLNTIQKSGRGLTMAACLGFFIGGSNGTSKPFEAISPRATAAVQNHAPESFRGLLNKLAASPSSFGADVQLFKQVLAFARRPENAALLTSISSSAHEERSLRALAIRLLGEVRVAHAVPIMATTLQERCPDGKYDLPICTLSAWTLTQIGTAEAVEILLAQLAEPGKSEILLAERAALSGIRNPDAVPNLVRFLDSTVTEQQGSVMELRIRVISALSQILDSKATAYVSRVFRVGPTENQYLLVEALRKSARKTAAFRLVAKVFDTTRDPALRIRAAAALFEMKGSSRAWKHLLDQTRAENEETRELAVAALGTVRQARVYDRMVELLGDSDEKVRYLARLWPILRN